VVALAVGGSVRALARIVGRTLDKDGLRAALRITTVRRSTKLAKVFGFDEERARVLPAGALILAEVAKSRWRAARARAGRTAGGSRRRTPRGGAAA
jgi:exopolyphosphatase/pppGpp-phosphohydrolase